MLQGLFGNATEINAKEVQKDLEATLVEGETVVKSLCLQLVVSLVSCSAPPR